MNPADRLQFLEQYGVLILPALVVAEQIGIPLVLAAIAVVALAADFTWYELGRRRGAMVLAKLCRISLEPDSCLGRAERIFARHGVRGMPVAKSSPA